MITLFKDPLFDTLDRVFENKHNYTSSNRTNITTTDSEYRVQITVPGLTKEDIKLSLKDGIITISHEKTDKESFSFTGSFKRTYEIPEDVDEKNITGTVENGILEIVLPKSKKRSVEKLISLT